MKRLAIASIFCLVCGIAAQAQDKIPPPIIDPADPLGVMRHVQRTRQQPFLVPRTLKLLRLKDPAPAAVCSVPLLDAHVDTEIDPRIATKPKDSAPMPSANLPAPACGK